MTDRTQGIFSTAIQPSGQLSYTCKPSNAGRNEEHVLQLVWLQQPAVCIAWLMAWDTHVVNEACCVGVATQ